MAAQGATHAGQRKANLKKGFNSMGVKQGIGSKIMHTRIHIKEDAEPFGIHRPETIPAHWMQQVRNDLEQDIALGVLERVPSNTPPTWCSHMHMVGKKTGEPRRVIDLRAVNTATSRQTHVTEPPFRQAMSVPANTWRYTTDGTGIIAYCWTKEIDM